MQALVGMLHASNIVKEGDTITEEHIMLAPRVPQNKAYSNFSYQLGKHAPLQANQYRDCGDEESADRFAAFIAKPESVG